jgi:hypothetical protein
MKRISESVDKLALNCLLFGLICLLAGFATVGGGVWFGGASYATLGLALVGGGSLTAFLSACWVHRDF